MAFLDTTGVGALWAKAKATFGARLTVSGTTLTLQNKADTPASLSQVTIPNATTSVPGAMSAADKAKLDGVATGATAVTVDSALSSSSTNPVQNKAVNTALAGKAASSHTHPDYENQNAFASVVVGSTTIAADSTGDALNLVAGSNVTITPDAANDKVTIASANTVYTHPAYTARAAGLYKVTVDATGHVSAATAVAKADITALGIPATNTTYSAATQSAAGLMSAADKVKVDGMATTISNAIAAANVGHATYKGSIAAESDISGLAYRQGWYWVVGTAGTYCGEACESGDMIFCNTDKGSTFSAANFDVVQTNMAALTTAELNAILV